MIKTILKLLWSSLQQKFKRKIKCTTTPIPESLYTLTNPIFHMKFQTSCERARRRAANRLHFEHKQHNSYPAQACRQANIVAKVSGGSWALLGWSFSGARPPRIDGHLLFKKVIQAWMKGSWGKNIALISQTTSKTLFQTWQLHHGRDSTKLL